MFIMAFASSGFFNFGIGTMITLLLVCVAVCSRDSLFLDSLMLKVRFPFSNPQYASLKTPHPMNI